MFYCFQTCTFTKAYKHSKFNTKQSMMIEHCTVYSHARQRNSFSNRYNLELTYAVFPPK